MSSSYVQSGNVLADKICQCASTSKNVLKKKRQMYKWCLFKGAISVLFMDYVVSF